MRSGRRAPSGEVRRKESPRSPWYEGGTAAHGRGIGTAEDDMAATAGDQMRAMQERAAKYERWHRGTRVMAGGLTKLLGHEASQRICVQTWCDQIRSTKEVAKEKDTVGQEACLETAVDSKTNAYLEEDTALPLWGQQATQAQVQTLEARLAEKEQERLEEVEGFRLLVHKREKELSAATMKIAFLEAEDEASRGQEEKALQLQREVDSLRKQQRRHIAEMQVISASSEATRADLMSAHQLELKELQTQLRHYHEQAGRGTTAVEAEAVLRSQLSEAENKIRGLELDLEAAREALVELAIKQDEDHTLEEIFMIQRQHNEELSQKEEQLAQLAALGKQSLQEKEAERDAYKAEKVTQRSNISTKSCP